jgi:glycosyltransferase involved in cell wall biosynthesis
MKILLATAYFLYPSSNGGAEMCRRVANGLRAAGHDVVVICLDFSQRTNHYDSRWTEQDGLRVLVIKPHERPPGRSMPLWRMRHEPRMALIAQELIESEKPDIVYMNFGWEIGEFALAAKEARIPTVFHVHCFAHLCARQFLIDSKKKLCSGPESVAKCFECLKHGHKPSRRFVETCAVSRSAQLVCRSLFGPDRTSSFLLWQALQQAFGFTEELRNSVAAFILTSQAISELHRRYGATEKQIQILPHFLPDDRLVRTPCPRKPEEGRVRLAFFGRLSPEKGFDLLLDALRQVERVLPDAFEFRIISREADQAHTMRSLESIGIEGKRVRVINNLTGASLNPVLAELDLCVIPSTCMEIGPLTMLEAIAQGVPCVASDSVGMKTLIQDGQNGRLFPVGNADALRDVLLEALSRPQNIEQWREALPQIMNEETYINRLTKIFRSVIAE